MRMNEATPIIAIVVILLLGLLQTAVNGSKAKRIQLFPLAALSAVLMLGGVIYWTSNYNLASEICELADFLEDGEIFVMNASLLLAYGLLRLILRPVLGKLFSSEDALSVFASVFYTHDDEYDKWFLKKQWVGFRRYFFAICVALNLATGIFLGLTWRLGELSMVWIMFFPCAALVVMNEVYNYINGQTKEEFCHNVMGDESSAQRISNYYKLREILEQLLPEPLLTAYSGCEFIGTRSAADMLEAMQESDNDRDRITASFFLTNDRYKTADVDCVQGTFHLMNRRNVIFFNPFYRDLSDYVILPMATALLSGKKCVVVCGRKAYTEDVRDWISGILVRYSRMRSLWRVECLSEREPECAVGVLSFTQLYDKYVINNNRDFFRETDFVLLVEPSVMLSTSQVGLSILAGEMGTPEQKPVYCVCDRSTNGLVDTLSHILRTEITDVVAMPLPRCSYSSLFWNADGEYNRQGFFDKQTKYLGNGTELAAIAVKNQVPEVFWYSETKAPVRDIKWIAGQFYATICKFMNLPSQQKSLYERIHFSSSLWSAVPENENFIIVEDEFCNMFGITRAFLSRGKKQAFVNVLSENYLLRDYMRCNRQLFMSDPNAVPSLVPDYAKTERNTILKLILMMNVRPVSDEEVLQELRLAGIETEDALAAMGRLLSRYTFADSDIFTVRTVRSTVDDFTVVSSNLYSVTGEMIDKYFADSLKSAFFLLEDEKGEQSYIDAKLFNHVTQLVLPGQFVTYDGKYYSVKYISPQSGVILRRASDLYERREYYRQIRHYAFDRKDPELIWQRRIGDVEFAELQTDLHVETSGYLELSDSHNLRTAKVVDFSEDPSVGRYARKYHNKSVLRVTLPDSDEKIRFTVCFLLTELFRSVFPDGWPYLAAVTRQPEDVDGMLNYMIYRFDADPEDNCIYIIEDSSLDLGLLNAVEKNFTRFMEIIADFLEWHSEKMREPAAKDPVPVKITVAEAEEKKKRSLLVRLFDRVRKLFNAGEKTERTDIPDVEKTDGSADKGKTAEPEAADNAPEDEPVNTTRPEAGQNDDDAGDEAVNIAPVSESEDGDAPDEDSSTSFGGSDDDAPGEDNDGEETPGSAEEPAAPEIAPVGEDTADEHPEDSFQPEPDSDPDLVAVDGTDIFEGEGMPEDNDFFETAFAAMGLTPLTRTRYQKECFLKLGFDEIDDRIRVDSVRRYLRVRGWSDNSLTKARKGELVTQLPTDAVNHCDFCGLPLSGVSFERLNDGRIRCNDCSGSAITKPEDFTELFYKVLGIMEDYYEIRFRAPVSARMTDARTIAKGVGMIFVPTTDIAARTLGYAQMYRGKYSVLVENGAPRLATIETLVHEMTHIWQYLNWDMKKIFAIYGTEDKRTTLVAKDIVYEGMAMWSSIQYLYQIGETYYASQQELVAEARQDVYGIGFRLYREQYPLLKDSSLLKYSPFMTFPVLEPEPVKDYARLLCGT